MRYPTGRARNGPEKVGLEWRTLGKEETDGEEGGDAEERQGEREREQEEPTAVGATGGGG
jgi:hypothetical protein